MLSANDLIASIVLAMPKKWASDRPSPELASGRSSLHYPLSYAGQAVL